MPRIKDSVEARLIQTLVYYDGPQVALFETNEGRKLFAVAIEDDIIEDRFFCVEVLDKSFRAYRDGRVDLNFLFRFSTARRLYTFDWDKMNDDLVVSLSRALARDYENSDNYPDRGFFEEDHTEEWLSEKISRTKQQYGIDGRWQASDFSRFCNKIGDVYSLLAIVEDLEAGSLGIDEQKKVLNALNEPTWRGGGSYVGFYNELASHSQDIRPLRVTAIQYASPGHIEVEGRNTVFQEITVGLKSFRENESALRKRSSAINRVLDKQGLKKADKDDSGLPQAMKGFLLTQSMGLAADLSVKAPEKLFEACRENVIIFTKVLLSYYRRIRDLNAFQKEGRLTVRPASDGGSQTTDRA